MKNLKNIKGIKILTRNNKVNIKGGTSICDAVNGVDDTSSAGYVSSIILQWICN